jgi:pilus assembly protein CpaB
LLLLSVALASGGLAASQVHEREQRTAAELGPSVQVLVAARDLAAGARVMPDAIAVRRMPERFVPPGSLVSPAGLLGARTAVPVAAGSFLNAGLLEGGEGGGGIEGGNGSDAARRGERAVTVGVAGGSALAGLAPGTRVDVLVSTETGPGGGRTVMALAGVELLRMGDPQAPSADASAGPASTGPAVLATLRVSVRQAIYLTAADNFAREIRLLPRPPGDGSRPGGAYSQSQL